MNEEGKSHTNMLKYTAIQIWQGPVLTSYTVLILHLLNDLKLFYIWMLSSIPLKRNWKYKYAGIHCNCLWYAYFEESSILKNQVDACNMNGEIVFWGSSPLPDVILSNLKLFYLNDYMYYATVPGAFVLIKNIGGRPIYGVCI